MKYMGGLFAAVGGFCGGTAIGATPTQLSYLLFMAVVIIVIGMAMIHSHK